MYVHVYLQEYDAMLQHVAYNIHLYTPIFINFGFNGGE